MENTYSYLAFPGHESLSWVSLAAHNTIFTFTPRGVTPKATAKCCGNFCTSPRFKFRIFEHVLSHRFYRCGLTKRGDMRTSFSAFLSFIHFFVLHFTPELDCLLTAFKFVFFAIRLSNLCPATPSSVLEFSTLRSLRSNSDDAIRDGKHGRSEGTVTCPFFHTTR